MTDSARRLAEADHPVRRTEILQELIDRAAERGGGKITVPPGEWTIATIFLRDGICLHLELGAVLLAHTDLDDYPKLPRGHNKDRSPYHLIVADGCDNITLEGDGVIDGQGEAFWEPPLRDLKARGVDITEDIARAPSHWPLDGPFWRGWKPRITPLLEIRHCRHVVLRDLTIRRSPGWTVHPFLCDDVRIDGITIDNHIYGPNTDGIDVNGCRDVHISNCRIVGCDDNIILKATEDARSCERVVVTNCSFRTNCAALGLGAETAMGIRDVSFSNCVVEQALRMVQLEMWEPGTIENVAIGNITGSTMTPDDVPMEKVIYMDIQQHRRPDPAELGTIRNVVVSGVTATTRGRCVLTAQNGSMIEDVTLRDIILTYPEVEDAAELAKTCRCGQNSNYNLEAQAANAVLVAENVRRLNVQNLGARMPAAGGAVPAMRAVWMRGVEDAVLDAPFLHGNGGPESAADIERCTNIAWRRGAGAA